MNRFIFRAIIFTSLVLLAGCNEGQSDSAVVPNKLPDLTQTIIAGSAHGDGQMYCAPVAVSNSMVGLFQIGSQSTLVKKLAGKAYMNTSLKNGTGTIGVLKGVEKFVEAQGLSSSGLRYQGWRKHIREFGTGIKRPSLSFIRNHVGEKKAAWLNIGWYKKFGSDLHRVGGHWVTLVGYNADNPSQIYIHDPSPRSGSSPRTQMLTLEQSVAQRLTGRKKGLPISAQGFLEISDGLPIPKRAHTAIIDGVVGLQL